MFLLMLLLLILIWHTRLSVRVRKEPQRSEMPPFSGSFTSKSGGCSPGGWVVGVASAWAIKTRGFIVWDDEIPYESNWSHLKSAFSMFSWVLQQVWDVAPSTQIWFAILIGRHPPKVVYIQVILLTSGKIQIGRILYSHVPRWLVQY